MDVMANGKFLPCWDWTAAIQPVAWSACWLRRPSSTTLVCDYRTGFYYDRRNINLQAVLTKYWFTWCCMDVFLAVMKLRVLQRSMRVWQDCRADNSHPSRAEVVTPLPPYVFLLRFLIRLCAIPTFNFSFITSSLYVSEICVVTVHSFLTPWSCRGHAEDHCVGGWVQGYRTGPTGGSDCVLEAVWYCWCIQRVVCSAALRHWMLQSLSATLKA